MEKKPILSIVVPTKDRYYYLKNLIELISSFKSDEIELVIQDNTIDNREIVNYLRGSNCTHLKYYHQKEHIPISDNATQAILNSSGKYVCFIGDDDGVLPSIVEVVKYMEDHGVDALLSSPTIYDWPDFGDNSIFRFSATLQYKIGTGRYRAISPKEEIKKCFNSGIRDLCLLPKVYQGIVKRSFLDKVYKRTNSFFPGPSPDMSNAIALALLSPRLVYYDAPLIISGQCKTVGGGERQLKHNNLPKITEVPFLPRDIASKWDDRMPRYWCADTIWPQSAISAYKAMGVSLPNIDFNQIMATFIFDHPYYYQECKRFVSNKGVFAFYMLNSICVRGFRYLYGHFSYFLSGKKRRAGIIIERNMETIKDVVGYLNKESLRFNK